jgi:hypothetical protein
MSKQVSEKGRNGTALRDPKALYITNLPIRIYDWCSEDLLNQVHEHQPVWPEVGSQKRKEECLVDPVEAFHKVKLTV